MNLQYDHSLKLLRDRDDFSIKHLRSISHLYTSAQQIGALGPRPDGWLDTMIYQGYGVGLVDARDRMVGFSVVRPMGIDESGDLVTYGECTLTRGNQEYYRDIVCSLLEATEMHEGKHCWGAFFKQNETAKRLFEIFQRMRPDEAPGCVKRELGHYSYNNIELIRLTL